MNDNYYEETLRTIDAWIQDGKINEALSRLEEELSMPYVPSAYLALFEQRLKELKQLRQFEAIKLSVTTDPQEILDGLNQDELNQLKALDALSQLNLRAHLPLVHSAFELLKDRLLVTLLIRILIQQSITDEFSFEDDGVRYHFIPASLTLPEESEGVESAKAYLERWCEKDPSLYQLCLQQLDLVSCLKLPQSYDEDEGKDLALEILKPIYIQLRDEAAYEVFEKTVIQVGSTH